MSLRNRKIFIFALSTCIWCKRTKEFLREIGANFDFVDVDLLNGKQLDDTMAEMRKFNPSQNFPTIIIDDETVIIGFNKEKISLELLEQ